MGWNIFKTAPRPPNSARQRSPSRLTAAWQGFRRVLGSLFGAASEGVGGADSGPATKGMGAEGDKAEFIKRLKAAAARGNGSAAAFYLINLKDLKRRFGERWPQIARKVDIVARRILDVRIGAGDSYMGFDGPIFVVLFENMEEEAAKAKCAMIAAEIEQKLIGGDGLALAVRASAARLEPHLTSELIDPRTLGWSLIKKDQPDDHHDQPGWTDAARPFEDTVIDWKRVSNGSASAVSLVPLRHSEDVEMENRWRPLMPDVSSVAVPAPHFVYRPMWSVANGAVSTFHCFPMRDAMAHAAMLFTDEVSALKLDLMTLRRTVEDIKTGFETSTPFIIGLPVHFSSLTDFRVRETFRQACALVPEPYWKRLVSEIIAVPEGVPKTRMHEAVGVAGRYFRAVNVRLPLLRPGIGVVVGSGAVAVGADLGACSNEDEKRVMALMDQFAAEAEKYALRTFIHGVRSTSMTASALGAGFNYIDGTPVGVSQFPQRMYRFMTEDIYADVLRHAPPAHQVSEG